MTICRSGPISTGLEGNRKPITCLKIRRRRKPRLLKTMEQILGQLCAKRAAFLVFVHEANATSDFGDLCYTNG
ncbi:hypothetical protein MPLA_670126 [Mesorhizobium sp. ORS 3359]|nr:hypothetical protein MPLA_670126 [Mesorhizobium sp. ORS 3359]